MRKLIISLARDRRLAALRDAALAKAGYAVAPSRSVEETLQILDKRRFSAIVMGHSISRAEKQRLVSAVKKINPVPIVAIYRQAPDVRVGADAYVASLETPEKLLTALAQICAAKPQWARSTCVL